MSMPYRTSKSAVFLTLGMTANIVVPIVISAPVIAAEFSDVEAHWARPFIEALAEENVISGFPDGTFKPNAPVTRAQFAAIVRQAFNENKVREARGFTDVTANYWATPAINEAYETGFMSGYPNRQFRPSEEIPKVQVLVSLASGLRLSPKTQPTDSLKVFRDATEIPTYAVNGVAAATEKSLVVNYPNVSYLNPNEVATRGDVAAFIYQALVNQGDLQPLANNLAASNYIVRETVPSTQTTTTNSTTTTTTNSSNTQNPQLRVTRGTKIPVTYLASDKVVVTPNETINLTLEVANDIQNSENKVLIPKGSKIEGQLVPRYSGSKFLGTQFVAQRLIVNNQSYTNLNATSNLVTGEKPSDVNNSTVQNTSATSAAQTILGTILGRSVNVESILTGRTTTPQTTQDTVDTLVIIDPETDLPLTFGSDFFVTSIASS
jgi:hypothetical protein